MDNSLLNKDIIVKDIKNEILFHVKHVSYETYQMPKIFTSKTQKIGEIGENIATMFLMKHGYSVLDRNYTKKWGELDIITEKQNKLHFIEVKSTSKDPIFFSSKTKVLDKNTKDTWRAEENMHPWKLKRISRTIQTYLLSNNISDEKEWQLDLLVVYLDLKNRKARVKVVENIIL